MEGPCFLSGSVYMRYTYAARRLSVRRRLEPRFWRRFGMHDLNKSIARRAGHLAVIPLKFHAGIIPCSGNSAFRIQGSRCRGETSKREPSP